jgi:hypothetical protein
MIRLKCQALGVANDLVDLPRIVIEYELRIGEMRATSPEYTRQDLNL